MHDQVDFRDFFQEFSKENFSFQLRQWIWVWAVCVGSLDTFRRRWWSKTEEDHTPFHTLQHQDTTNQYYECKVFSTVSLVQDTKKYFTIVSRNCTRSSIWESNIPRVYRKRCLLTYCDTCLICTIRNQLDKYGHPMQEEYFPAWDLDKSNSVRACIQ